MMLVVAPLLPRISLSPNPTVRQVEQEPAMVIVHTYYFRKYLIFARAFCDMYEFTKFDQNDQYACASIDLSRLFVSTCSLSVFIQ